MENYSIPPVVSVIIPTIKYDHFTHQSLLSVFAQKYSSWEIVLVLDGASIDDVPESIVNDARVQIVIHTSRLGTPTSLNDGVQAARGKFIARLDADDIAHPDRFAFQVKYLEDNSEVCCISTGGHLIDDEGSYLGDLSSKSSKSDIRADLLRKNQLVHSSVMYRKSHFNLINGYNPLMVRMQDYDLFLRLAKVAPIAYSAELMCAYRTHAGQHSRKTSPFKIYTWEILKQRNLLRKTLKAPKLLQLLHDLKWYLAQVLRYSGLRKPGYLNATLTEVETGRNLEWLNPSSTF